MSRSIRAMAALMTLVALAFALSLGQTAPAGQRRQAAQADANGNRPDADTADDPGRAPGRPPSIQLRDHALPIADLVGQFDRVDGVAIPGLDRRAGRGRRRSSGGGGRGNCWAHFPQPATGTWPNVNWDDVDLFESTFDAFDASGVKVWLQVEPARCDVPMLIDLMYQQYGHHPSVIGFGVDVEWYRKDLSRTGKPVTDAEAQAWVAQTRTHDAADLVLVKHWLTEKMPPTYRAGLVFVDDSQGHGSLSAMVNEFSAWGQTFAPAPVGFQYGYQSDKTWWSTLPDPPRDIGNALLSAIPNTRDLVWVDFTAYDIWPPE